MLFGKTEFKPLSTTASRTHGWADFSLIKLLEKESLLPVSFIELAKAQAVMPLAFLGQSQADKKFIRLVGVTSIFQEENLFIDANGKWVLSYLPALCRHYPFAMLDLQGVNQETRKALCFEHSTGLYRENPDPEKKEQRFFDDQGALNPLLQKALESMATVAASQEKTAQAVYDLAQAGLLMSWNLYPEAPEADQARLVRVFCINQEALNQLSGEVLKSLQSSGALAIAYAQLFSMQHLPRLKALHQQRQQEKAAAAATQSSSDTLSFDWLSPS